MILQHCALRLTLLRTPQDHLEAGIRIQIRIQIQIQIRIQIRHSIYEFYTKEEKWFWLQPWAKIGGGAAVFMPPPLLFSLMGEGNCPPLLKYVCTR